MAADDILIFGGSGSPKLTRQIASYLGLEPCLGEVYAAVTHGAISERTLERLADSPIRKFFITDSIETQPVALPEIVEVVSVAPLFGEAIRRIHTKESISVLLE